MKMLILVIKTVFMMSGIGGIAFGTFAGDFLTISVSSMIMLASTVLILSSLNDMKKKDQTL